MMGKFRVMKLKRRSVSNKMRCNRIPHLYQKNGTARKGSTGQVGFILGVLGTFECHLNEYAVEEWL